MAIILRTAYFFNPFCIKQVPINCSKVNPMEQKYFVLANNVFSDGCGGYLTIGTEIKQTDTIDKNSEDWGLLLHVSGGGEDYWITGTAAEFKAQCECTPECSCVLTFEDVDGLPEEGAENTTYIVRTGAEAGVYIWNGSAYVLVASTGSVGLNYKEYSVLMNQVGTNAPTISTTLNDTITGITLSYLSVGKYRINKTGAFPLNKTTVELFNSLYPVQLYYYYRLDNITIDYIDISTYYGPGFTNDLMSNYGIRIRVYN